MTHRYNLDVRFHELDPYNHVNHGMYVTYFEIGRAEALAFHGVSLLTLEKKGVQIFILHIEVTFTAPAAAGDRLIIETERAERSAKSGRATRQWTQRILREDAAEETLLATATVTAAIIGSSGRPIRPPAWLDDALAKL